MFHRFSATLVRMRRDPQALVPTRAELITFGERPQSHRVPIAGIRPTPIQFTSTYLITDGEPLFAN